MNKNKYNKDALKNSVVCLFCNTLAFAREIKIDYTDARGVYKTMRKNVFIYNLNFDNLCIKPTSKISLLK